MVQSSLERISIKYGILTGISLIIFFLFMKLVGLVEIPELRILNVIFLFCGVFLAIRTYIREHSQNASYLNGLGTGLLTSGIALVIFCAFVIIYLKLLDPKLMDYLINNAPYGEYLNPYIAGASIFLEGIMSGLLVSFILMQYYKKSHLSKSETEVL